VIRPTSGQRLSFFALVCFVTGCGTCDAGVDDLGGNSNDGGNGSGNNNAGGSTGDFIADGGGTSGCTTCSADLHQILDCDGNFIQECPSETGCGAGGTCVPACQSAAENKAPSAATSVDAPGSSQSRCLASRCVARTTPICQQSAGRHRRVGLHLRAHGARRGFTYQPLTGGTLAPGQLGILFLFRRVGIFDRCPNARIQPHVDDAPAHPGVTGSATRSTSRRQHLTSSLTTSTPAAHERDQLNHEPKIATIIRRSNGGGGTGRPANTPLTFTEPRLPRSFFR
jgi:hypothetical protein